ncbi:MAG: hypothetical protein M3Q16_06045 [Pseudomonadota bacterium]|nr:hypothetical protein [Pseudomonadota bacterium]
MKKPVDRDIFGYTLAQSEDWAEKSSRKMFKRHKKEQNFMDDVSERSGRKVIPISQKPRHRPRAS